MAALDISGKKIVFFYPPSWLKEEMIRELIENEYEAYAIDDHKLLFPFIKANEFSIVFINIDSGPDENEWDKYLRVIGGTPELKNKVQIGILSNDNSKALVSKYLGELGAEAGYIILKQRTQDVKKAIYNILQKIDAKGRRKFLRVSCSDSGKATFNIQVKAHAVSGKILDISSVGMACYFDDERINLNVGDVLPDVQLRLLGKVTTVVGKVAGVRDDLHRIFVIMFDEKMNFTTRDKIHSFIFYTLDSSMQKTLKDLTTAQR